MASSTSVNLRSSALPGAMFIEELVAKLQEIAERNPGCEVRVGLDVREPTELAVEDVFEIEGDSASYAVILALEI